MAGPLSNVDNRAKMKRYNLEYKPTKIQPNPNPARSNLDCNAKSFRKIFFAVSFCNLILS